MATAVYSFPFPTQLKRLVNPTDPQDAATKSYVDAIQIHPGGSNTQVQFNDSGNLGGSSSLTFDSANPSNGLQVLSSFVANPGAHILEVHGLSAYMGSVADGGVGVDNTVTTLSSPVTQFVGSSVLLGDVANVYIGGGNAGDLLTTDGVGELSWTPAPPTTLVVIGRSGQINVPVVNRILTVGGRSGNISVFVN